MPSLCASAELLAQLGKPRGGRRALRLGLHNFIATHNQNGPRKAPRPGSGRPACLCPHLGSLLCTLENPPYLLGWSGGTVGSPGQKWSVWFPAEEPGERSCAMRNGAPHNSGSSHRGCEWGGAGSGVAGHTATRPCQFPTHVVCMGERLCLAQPLGTGLARIRGGSASSVSAFSRLFNLSTYFIR